MVFHPNNGCCTELKLLGVVIVKFEQLVVVDVDVDDDDDDDNNDEVEEEIGDDVIPDVMDDVIGGTEETDDDLNIFKCFTCFCPWDCVRDCA